MSIVKYERGRVEKRFTSTLLICFLFFPLILTLVACGEHVPIQCPEYVVESDIASDPYYEQNADETPDYSLVDYSTEPEPALLPSPIPHRIIAAGTFHSLVITDGSLWAWGCNRFGQLGDGTTENRAAPVQIGTDSDWVSVDTGIGYTVALKTDGSLWAWGNNTFGVLGDGTTIDRDTPVQIGTDTDWVDVVLGDSRALAVKADGSIWSWGWWGIANHDCYCFYLRMTGVIAAGGTSWGCTDCNVISMIGDGTYGENRYSPVMILDGRR